MPKKPARKQAVETRAVSATESVYVALRQETPSPRTRNGLERVKRALDHLVETRSVDFGVANVARVVDILTPGLGPKEQSIRNAEGAIYRRLIAEYRASHVVELEAPPKATEVDDLLARIRDQAVAARVRDLHLRLEEMTRRNEYLKRQYQRLQPVEPRALIQRGAAQATQLTAVASLPFDEAQQRSVRRFLERAPDLLECQWDEPSGALLTASGHEVAGAGFRQVLQSITGAVVPTEVASVSAAPQSQRLKGTSPSSERGSQKR